PAIEDVDNDADLEIFFGNVNGVSAIDNKEQRGYGTYWNMFRCNPRRTGNLDDAETGVEESDITRPLLFKVYPNPFKGSTRIFLTAQRNQKVDIAIYNIVGQKVKDLSSISKETYRIVTWNGKNNHDKPVPTGVYFCVVNTDKGEEVVKKLIKIE
ncbi:MAG: T9SS type A sorting domain-containing protein, partial [Candidatus Cloacimonadota bacterium]